MYPTSKVREKVRGCEGDCDGVPEKIMVFDDGGFWSECGFYNYFVSF